MKKKFSTSPIKVTLSLLTTASVFGLLVACGGGGGGEGGDYSPNITVTSVNPDPNASKVDPRSVAITATFSAEIDPLSFMTQKQALGQLLSTKKDSAGKDLVIVDVASNTAVNAGSLSLKDLTSGRYMTNLTINGTLTPAVFNSYNYIKEASGAGYSLSISFLNQNVTLDFTSAELLNSGIVNSNLFKVQGGSSAAFGEIVVEGKKVTFYPVKSLDWSSTYKVTLAKEIMDKNKRPLADDYTWQFSTIEVPKPGIENASPVGMNANPIKKLYAKPNFVVDVASLTRGSVVLNKLVRKGTDQSAEKMEIPVSLNYDLGTSQIVITPGQELEYLQEYEVIVTATNGITGSFGQQTGFRLPTDYVWTFTTGAPQVLAHTPDRANPATPDVERDSKITLELNFKPNLATIPSGIVITDSTNSLNVPFTATVKDGSVTLTPSQLLRYGTLYTVTVLPALSSVTNSAVHLESNSTFQFTTVVRKMLNKSPAAGTTGVSTRPLITVSFNFDVQEAALKNRAYFSVDQTVNGSTTAAAGSVFYDSTTRTVSFDPTQEFKYNTVVTVTVANSLPSVDGSPISAGGQWSFTVRNEKLSISTTSPTNGNQSVPLNNLIISARLSAPVDASSFNSSSAIVVKGANGRIVSGVSTLDGNLVSFLPGETLCSYCNYTATLSSSLRGSSNETQSGTNSWSFMTDGLAVTGVYVNFAYSDFTSVFSTVQFKFNYPLGYVFYTDITVKDHLGRVINGNLYRSGNTVEFSPYGHFEYGEQYTASVNMSITGANGEKLLNNDVTYFNTENLPIDVVDYGPTGRVNPDDFFWVTVSDNVNSAGFPKMDGRFSPYASRSLTNDNAYTIYQTPTYSLSPNTYYNVLFSFDKGGGSIDSYNWYFTTTSLATPLSAGQTKAQALSAEQRASAAGRQLLGCRANANCLGSLKTNSVDGYKKVIAARQLVNLHEDSVRTRTMGFRKARLGDNAQ